MLDINKYDINYWFVVALTTHMGHKDPSGSNMRLVMDIFSKYAPSIYIAIVIKDNPNV